MTVDGIDIWLIDTGNPAIRSPKARVLRDRIAGNAIARSLDVAYDEPRVIRGCAICGSSAHGRPEVAGRPDLAISLSASEGVMAVAVGKLPCLGVDIEAIRPISVDSIAEMLAPAERQAIDGLPPHSRTQSFYGVWTRKEACAKATGLGFAMDAASFAVSVPPAPPAIVVANTALDAKGRLTLEDLAMPEGWAGACCYSGGAKRLTVRSLDLAC